MSSNDQLIILKNKKDKFEIHHHFCVDNEFKPNKNTLLVKKDNLVEAIKYANAFCNEYPYVEYGYHICGSCLK
jgi:hypothetical protein